MQTGSEARAKGQGTSPSRRRHPRHRKGYYARRRKNLLPDCYMVTAKRGRKIVWWSFKDCEDAKKLICNLATMPGYENVVFHPSREQVEWERSR
jgi:hypothetical protein